MRPLAQGAVETLRPHHAVLRGLVIGAAGGAAGVWIGIPAPWLAGSMAAAVAAVFAGVEIGMPGWLKAAAFIFLGIQTGTSVTWETLDRAAQWPLSVACLGLTVVAIVWACTVFYMRVRKWDAATALFASLPGALAMVLLLAVETRADMRRVTIAQCIRLIFLVAAIPTLIAWLSPAPELGEALPVIDSIFELAVLVGLSAAAGLLLDHLRAPAGLIMGPMLVSAALELSGVVAGAAPMGLLVPANVVLGVIIATRFTGFRFGEVLGSLRDGFSGFLLALAIAACGAAIASAAGGLPFALTLLAFSPGGLEAMTVMAFALNLDPAYVAAHQIARYVGIALLMPLVTPLLLRRLGP